MFNTIPYNPFPPSSASASGGGGGGSYVLPIASADTLGGVKVGDNLSIDANGVLSARAGGGSDDYTNTEQKVGTWFGANLYRKSYYFDNVVKGTHSLEITNLDKIIKIEGGYIERFVSPSVSYGFVPFPYSNGAFTPDNAVRVEFSITNGTITFDWGGNHDPLEKDALLTVYYTKTESEE